MREPVQLEFEFMRPNIPQRWLDYCLHSYAAVNNSRQVTMRFPIRGNIADIIFMDDIAWP